MDWSSVPSASLQAVAGLLSTKDASSARLACRHWASAVPVQQVCVQLTVGNTGEPLPPSLQLSQLLQDLGIYSCALKGVSTLVVNLVPCWPQGNAGVTAGAVVSRGSSNAGCSQQQPQQQQQAMQSVKTVVAKQLYRQASIAEASAVQQLDRLVYALPRLHAVTIKTHTSNSLSIPSSSSSSSCQASIDTVLVQLLGLPQLQQRLRSLTLSTSGAWLPSQQLAGLLLGLSGLSALRLVHCPLAVLARLPSLPRLQQLGFVGRPTEPVPPSYSIKRQGPMLPPLPGLTSLSLQALPLDLVQQELEGQQQASRQQQQGQQRAQMQPCGQQLGRVLPACPQGCTRTIASSSSGSSGGGSSRGWCLQKQWVTSSIAAQCPNLQQQFLDLPLAGAWRQPSTLPAGAGVQLAASTCRCNCCTAAPAAGGDTVQCRTNMQQCLEQQGEAVRVGG